MKGFFCNVFKIERSNSFWVCGVCILLHLLWSFCPSGILQVLFRLLDFLAFGCQTTASMDKNEKIETSN